MSDFNAAKGELVPGGLALVVGYSHSPVNVGMIVTTHKLVSRGHTLPDGAVFVGDTAWLCKAEKLSVRRNGRPVMRGFAYIKAENLLPITPEPDPLQVQTEQEQLV